MNLDILGQKCCFQTLSQHSSSDSPLNMHMLVLFGCDKSVEVAYKILS